MIKIEHELIKIEHELVKVEHELIKIEHKLIKVEHKLKMRPKAECSTRLEAMRTNLMLHEEPCINCFITLHMRKPP